MKKVKIMDLAIKALISFIGVALLYYMSLLSIEQSRNII